MLVVPAAWAVLALCAPQATAHTELDNSSPGANATLAGLPPRVTLTFSDEMTQKYAKVAVTGPDGQSAGTGAPQVQGKSVSLPVDVRAPAGRYTVGYRVVSADGHPVSGSYTFTVEKTDRPSPSPRAAESADAPPARAEPKTAAEKTGGESNESSGTGVTGLASAGALALIAAAAGVYVVRRRRAGRDH
ncbi:copper resistance protein CopC [Streptomyces sp. BPPL-273]|uniref:copper resistance CopC family protein n=1 Tax=Streptomyces TaxID=1883 RepID=UPI0024AF488C|nr:copper resistance CopC family protein [Streptomyces sp. BPPL-273]WHM29908.1 copper resistance protein CopC [Streptomyces sp. BPPL-273]